MKGSKKKKKNQVIIFNAKIILFKKKLTFNLPPMNIF